MKTWRRPLHGAAGAHLIGPGFESELIEGLMLAPSSVNLDLQNSYIENFIRTASNAPGTNVTLQTRAIGRRLVIPLVGGKVEHVDILVRVEYQITVKWREPSSRGSTASRSRSALTAWAS